MAGTRFALFVSLLLASLFLGCHRGESPITAKAHLLTRLPWTYQEYAVNGQPIDRPTDTLQFRPDGTSVLSDGANSTPGSRWELIDGGRGLVFNRGTKSEATVEIVELSSTRPRFKGSNRDSTGDDVPFEAMCIHKCSFGLSCFFSFFGFFRLRWLDPRHQVL
jgi:hypothetical protein